MCEQTRDILRELKASDDYHTKVLYYVIILFSVMFKVVQMRELNYELI